MSDFQNNDPLIIGGVELQSRLFIGTGKYSNDALIPDVCASSGAQVITVAMRRVEKGQQGIVGHIPSHMRLLPNTSGARTAEEAVRLARLARAAGCGDWIKIEVISDTRHLLPDGYETAKATEILAKEGFTVLPYINPDLYVARACADAGAAAVMPLGAPIGTNRGLRTREMIGILIEEIDLPIVVDAGIGLPCLRGHGDGRRRLPGEHRHRLVHRSGAHGPCLPSGRGSRSCRLAGRSRCRACLRRRRPGLLSADGLPALGRGRTWKTFSNIWKTTGRANAAAR